MTEQDYLAALDADGAEVDRLVSGLDAAQWATATPAEGWTVAHQIAHLAATFRMAAMAAADPDAFTALAGRLSGDFDQNVRSALAPYLQEKPDVLLARWRTERAAAHAAIAALPPAHLVPWLIRPIPAQVLAAAGMMELFGHGQDVADALSVRREPTDRIRHIVAFAVRTWDFGYLARGLAVPEVELAFSLTAPSGAVWQFGPAESAERVEGVAEDFCLLVTRRRNRADLRLTATGAHADRWLDVAQAYRGPAGPGRVPGQFAHATG